MRYYLSLLLSLLILFSASCKKEEKFLHEDLVIEGNEVPPYYGIPTILVDNYINKMNIDLIGLKPDDTSRDSAVSHLEKNNLNEDARIEVIEDILNEKEYQDRLFQVISDLLLNGMGYNEVEVVYKDNEFVRDFLYQSGDTLTAQVIDNELDKLQKVLDAPDDYKAGSITMNEYFYRLSYNLIYDEINMGSENFVKACFENFFKRNPTIKELEQSVNMVDGLTSQLLLKEGRNKIDFLNIMVENQEFYQGRVLDAYRTLLLRDPSSNELTNTTNIFISSSDYGEVQIDIVKTDEYAGFE